MKSNQSVFEPPLVWLALLGGIGRFPVAAGTAATLLVGMPAAWAMSAIQHPMWMGGLLAAFLLLSWAACAAAARTLGREDPPEVVVDELAGYLVTMFALPADGFSLFMGFVWFRVFDIWKPWPIRWADARVPGGLGILLDDLLAGLAAHWVLRAILSIWG